MIADTNKDINKADELPQSNIISKSKIEDGATSIEKTNKKCKIEAELRRQREEFSRQIILDRQKYFQRQLKKKSQKRFLKKVQLIRKQQVKKRLQKISKSSQNRNQRRLLLAKDVTHQKLKLNRHGGNKNKLKPDNVSRKKTRKVLTRQRRRLQKKLKLLEREVDDFERVKRFKEIPLINKYAAIKLVQDQEYYEKEQKSFIENAIAEYKDAPSQQVRLKRMHSDRDVFLEQLRIERNLLYLEKLKAFELAVEEERKKRLAQRIIDRREKRRKEWIREKNKRLRQRKQARQNRRQAKYRVADPEVDRKSKELRTKGGWVKIIKQNENLHIPSDKKHRDNKDNKRCPNLTNDCQKDRRSLQNKENGLEGVLLIRRTRHENKQDLKNEKLRSQNDKSGKKYSISNGISKERNSKHPDEECFRQTSSEHFDYPPAEIDKNPDNQISNRQNRRRQRLIMEEEARRLEELRKIKEKTGSVERSAIERKDQKLHPKNDKPTKEEDAKPKDSVPNGMKNYFDIDRSVNDLVVEYCSGNKEHGYIRKSSNEHFDYKNPDEERELKNEKLHLQNDKLCEKVEDSGQYPNNTKNQRCYLNDNTTDGNSRSEEYETGRRETLVKEEKKLGIQSEEKGANRNEEDHEELAINISESQLKKKDKWFAAELRKIKQGEMREREHQARKRETINREVEKEKLRIECEKPCTAPSQSSAGRC